MRAGTLRHRMTVETFSETGKDNAGQPTGDWLSSKSIFVAIERLSGRTAEIARQMYSDATHQIHCRWFPGLTIHQRLRFGNRLFHIREVNNVREINREYVLICTEDLN